MNEHLNKPIDIKKLYETLLKYISKKIDSKELIINEDIEINIPKFKSIDTALGLSHMGNHKMLYIKVLKEFYIDNKDLELEKMNNEEFKIGVHTLQSLSANIGATFLNSIIIELNKTQDKGLLSKFYAELNIVLEELKILNIEEKIEDKNKPKLELDTKKEILNNLKQSALKKQSQACNAILDNIDKYNLSNKDKELFAHIKELIQKREYKNIVEMI